MTPEEQVRYLRARDERFPLGEIVADRAVPTPPRPPKARPVPAGLWSQEDLAAGQALLESLAAQQARRARRARLARALPPEGGSV